MRLRPTVSETAPTIAATAGLLAGRTAIEVTPALTMLEGPSPGQVYRMAATGRRAYIAGRASVADIPIPDSSVSRRHARLWVELAEGGERAMIEDLASTNGTWINGSRTERGGLERGDRVMLGSVVLRFDLLDPVEVHVVEELEQQVRSASLDPLTGLQTRRAVGDLSAPACGPGERMAAIILDLDHFKQVNDGFGHPAGDAVLTLAARTLAEALRGDDLAVRWGGEEFLALLPGAGVEAALAIASRVLEALKTADTSAITPGRGLSASLGVASAQSGETFASLIGRADRALYRAKLAGRGRVELA
ncbi:MAG: GGDEF domain-containing protein [Candidatus Wallbacteria bacterium]|nr:GGDEF domain-containing protein [Candidatus Wallbacteria bacterium]